MPTAEKIRIAPRFYVTYAMFTLLMFPPHEFFHYLAYRAMRVPARITLNTVTPYDETRRRPAAELAGPGLNLLVAATALLAYHRIRRKVVWLAALALAASMFRMAVYLIVAVAAVVTGSGLTLGNDEPIAAHLLGLPSLTFVAILGPVFAAIVWAVLQTVEGTWLRKATHVLGLMLTTVVLGVIVGSVLDPWMFPRGR